MAYHASPVTLSSSAERSPEQVGLPFYLALPLAIVTAPIVFLAGCFAYGCMLGVIQAFRDGLNRN